MRVGISFVSVEKARANLHAENPSWDFDAVRAAARARWNRELSRVRVETGDTRLRRMFYTALYHALLAPNLYSDADGGYLGMDDVVHQSGAQPVDRKSGVKGKSVAGGFDYGGRLTIK